MFRSVRLTPASPAASGQWKRLPTPFLVSLLTMVSQKWSNQRCEDYNRAVQWHHRMYFGNMSLEGIIAAVVSVVAAIASPFVIEKYKRKHRNREKHFADIKEMVLKHHLDLLVDYYLPALSGESGWLDIKSVNVAANPGEVKWNYEVAIRAPAYSIVTTLGDSIAYRVHDISYPPLHNDARQNHFKELFCRIEGLDSEYRKLAEDLLELARQWSGKLKESLGLPSFDGFSSQGRGANYPKLAIFIHAALWVPFPGTLGSSEEQGKYVLRWQGEGSVCGQGTKFEMDCCQRVVQDLINKVKGSMVPVRQQAQQLKSKAVTLKTEIAEILRKNKLPGNCPYLES